MAINPNFKSDDLYRLIICLAIILVSSILVGYGKLDINVFIVVITGISSYYLGKSSNKGSIIE